MYISSCFLLCVRVAWISWMYDDFRVNISVPASTFSPADLVYSCLVGDTISVLRHIELLLQLMQYIYVSLPFQMTPGISKWILSKCTLQNCSYFHCHNLAWLIQIPVMGNADIMPLAASNKKVCGKWNDLSSEIEFRLITYCYSPLDN